ncbi:uncharacterized protein LOC143416538 [Maylandia zebra]|uniref:uncharacterized protein LOC143416538 n=1 Tax=Maylandia zebra TaxID=106582 RepID=UPI00403C9B52
MDPADSRFAFEGENLALLWDYCWRVVHAASPYKRQLESQINTALPSSTISSRSSRNPSTATLYPSDLKLQWTDTVKMPLRSLSCLCVPGFVSISSTTRPTDWL